MLTIGIPSKGVSESTLRVFRLALSFSFVEEVLVGINPGVDNLEIPGSLSADPRVNIIYHPSDLGLYGNFRYLANKATSSYFMWLCTDDSPTPQLETLLQVINSEKANLVIPNWDLADYFPHLQEHAKVRTPGKLPSLASNRLRVHSAMHTNPSWMFGIWDTKYLVSIFPKRSFDWLDCHILQKVLISNTVKLVQVPQPATIGTWSWANKLPHSVKASGHSASWAILYQHFTALNLISLWPPSVIPIFRRMGTLRSAARSMNAEIKKNYQNFSKS
jgi:hypothetical protein